MFKNLSDTDVWGGAAFAAFMLGLTAHVLWDEGWDLLLFLFG